MEHHRLIWLWWLVLVGCTPTPTPLPVQPIVTPTPLTAQQTPSATETESFRYGVLPNAADYVPIGEIGALGATVETTESIEGYNLLVGYGVYDGWEALPQPPVTLLLNTTLPPLNDPTIANVLLSAVQPEAVAEQLGIPGVEILYTPTTADNRALLANAGYPAGITLYGRVTDAPGTAMLLDQLADVGIQVTLVTHADSPVHMTLSQLNTPDGQALYSVPLSYTTSTEIPLNFTDDGWPLPVR